MSFEMAKADDPIAISKATRIAIFTAMAMAMAMAVAMAMAMAIKLQTQNDFLKRWL